MFNRLKKLEAAHRRHPDAPLFARLADAYLARDKVEEALELCLEGCERFPDYPAGFQILGKCYQASGQLEEARSALDRALRLDAANPGGFRLLAEIYQELGVPTLALKNMRQALHFDPLNPALSRQADELEYNARLEASPPQMPRAVVDESRTPPPEPVVVRPLVELPVDTQQEANGAAEHRIARADLAALGAEILGDVDAEQQTPSAETDPLSINGDTDIEHSDTAPVSAGGSEAEDPDASAPLLSFSDASFADTNTESLDETADQDIAGLDIVLPTDEPDESARALDAAGEFGEDAETEDPVDSAAILPVTELTEAEYQNPALINDLAPVADDGGIDLDIVLPDSAATDWRQDTGTDLVDDDGLPQDTPDAEPFVAGDTSAEIDIVLPAAGTVDAEPVSFEPVSLEQSEPDLAVWAADSVAEPTADETSALNPTQSAVGDLADLDIVLPDSASPSVGDDIGNDEAPSAPVDLGIVFPDVAMPDSADLYPTINTPIIEPVADPSEPEAELEQEAGLEVEQDPTSRVMPDKEENPPQTNQSSGPGLAWVDIPDPPQGGEDSESDLSVDDETLLGSASTWTDVSDVVAESAEATSDSPESVASERTEEVLEEEVAPVPASDPTWADVSDVIVESAEVPEPAVASESAEEVLEEEVAPVPASDPTWTDMSDAVVESAEVPESAVASERTEEVLEEEVAPVPASDPTWADASDLIPEPIESIELAQHEADTIALESISEPVGPELEPSELEPPSPSADVDIEVDPIVDEATVSTAPEPEAIDETVEEAALETIPPIAVVGVDAAAATQHDDTDSEAVEDAVAESALSPADLKSEPEAPEATAVVGLEAAEGPVSESVAPLADANAEVDRADIPLWSFGHIGTDREEVPKTEEAIVDDDLSEVEQEVATNPSTAIAPSTRDSSTEEPVASVPPSTAPTPAPESMSESDAERYLAELEMAAGIADTMGADIEDGDEALVEDSEGLQELTELIEADVPSLPLAVVSEPVSDSIEPASAPELAPEPELVSFELGAEPEPELYPEGEPPQDEEGVYNRPTGLATRDDGELIRLFQEIESDRQVQAAVVTPTATSPPAPAAAPVEVPKPVAAAPPPGSRIATVTLAEIYSSQGLVQRAIDTYRRILEQDPGNREIEAQLAALENRA
jgi:hypothetical protein